jgi:uncharacterized protein YozE (UPF0346 family)
MRNGTKTFYQWLRTHKDDDTPIGDLARDAGRDSRFPRGVTQNNAVIRNHLNRMNACPDALTAFESAWDEYGGYRKGGAQ